MKLCQNANKETILERSSDLYFGFGWVVDIALSHESRKPSSIAGPGIILPCQ